MQKNNSTLICFANILNYELERPSNFNYLNSTNRLRCIAQLRLINKYNNRLILRNRIFKIRNNEYCYCCCTMNSLQHMLNECFIYNDIREKFLEKYDKNFINLIKYVTDNDVKNLTDFILKIFEKYESIA